MSVCLPACQTTHRIACLRSHTYLHGCAYLHANEYLDYLPHGNQLCIPRHVVAPQLKAKYEAEKKQMTAQHTSDSAELQVSVV